MAGGSWDVTGAVFTVAFSLTLPCAATPASSRLGPLSAVVSGGWVRDAGRLGPPAPPTAAPVNLTGSWGVATVPAFLPITALRPGAWAFDAGRNVGLGAGDVLELRFDSAPRHLPLGSRAAVDAVFAFSSPLGVDYTGAWVETGPYADSVCRITVTAAASPADPGTSVGAFTVSVRASAGLTSIDGSTAASNATVLLAFGTWGEVPTVRMAVASFISARVTVDWGATRFIAGITLYCSNTFDFSDTAYASSLAAGALLAVNGSLTVGPFAPRCVCCRARAYRSPCYASRCLPLMARARVLSGVAHCRCAIQYSFGAGRKEFDATGGYSESSVQVRAAALGTAIALTRLPLSPQLTVPLLTGVTTTTGGQLGTEGATGIVFAGSGLGYPGAQLTALYTAVPATAGAVGDSTRTYAASGCRYVVPPGGAPVVQCVSAPGAGGSFSWQLSVDGGARCARMLRPGVCAGC